MQRREMHVWWGLGRTRISRGRPTRRRTRAVRRHRFAGVAFARLLGAWRVCGRVRRRCAWRVCWLARRRVCRFRRSACRGNRRLVRRLVCGRVRRRCAWRVCWLARRRQRDRLVTAHLLRARLPPRTRVAAVPPSNGAGKTIAVLNRIGIVRRRIGQRNDRRVRRGTRRRVREPGNSVRRGVCRDLSLVRIRHLRRCHRAGVQVEEGNLAIVVRAAARVRAAVVGGRTRLRRGGGERKRVAHAVAPTKKCGASIDRGARGHASHAMNDVHFTPSAKHRFAIRRVRTACARTSRVR